METNHFGANVIYFALGVTEGHPAGAFWADKIILFMIYYYVFWASIWNFGILRRWYVLQLTYGSVPFASVRKVRPRQKSLLGQLGP